MGIMGPMAAVIIGVVAGFVAFMLQKKITNPTQNKSLKIAAITVAASYLVLIMLFLAIQTNVIWDNTGNGIGSWTGTPERMVRVYAPLGGIDMDPDLSPSYAYDFVLKTYYYPMIIAIGIIVSSFLVTYFIVKWKKKPTRPYLALVLAGWLLDFGIRNFYLSHPYLSQVIDVTPEKGLNLIGHLASSFWLPIIAIIIAGILLYKSSLIRKWLKR